MAARQGTITAAQDHTDRTPRRCVPPPKNFVLLVETHGRRLPIFTAKTRRRRVEVGCAVRCAPEFVMQTRLLELNLVFPRSYERGYERLKRPAGRGLARPTY